MLKLNRDERSTSKLITAGKLVGLGFAGFLCLASTPGIAQSAFDFEDPMDEVLKGLGPVKPQPVAAPEPAAEQPAPVAEQTPPAPVADTPPVEDTATSPETLSTDDAEPVIEDAPVTEAVEAAPDQPQQEEPVAEPVSETETPEAIMREPSASEQIDWASWLLPIVAFLGILGAGWLAVRAFLRHRSNDAEASAPGETIYATQLDQKRRRLLDSGAHVRRAAPIDTGEETSNVEAIEDDGDEPVNELESDKTYFQRRSAGSHDRDGDSTDHEADKPDASDPSTWRRPNLDRLKESIRADWKGDSVEDETPSPDLEDREAEEFAKYFAAADDAMPQASREAITDKEASSSVLDMLDSFESERVATAGDIPLEELFPTDGETSERPGDDDTALDLTLKVKPRPTREEALRRVKALKDAVKVG